MSKLVAAAERLKSALDRLEGLAAPLAERAGRADAHAARIAELSTENENLVERMASLEDDTRSAVAINEEVGSRLDSAIGEIRAALAR